MTDVHLCQSIKFLIGIIHIREFIHKPCISLRILVLQWNRLSILQRHDDVTHVQHIEYRPDTVTLDDRHIALGFCHSLHHALHFRCNIGVDKFLIAAQFGSMVATDTLVIIWGFVFIKRALREIQHTVVATVTLILKDKLISLGQLLRGLAFTLGYKHVIIEIALVHLPHVNQAEHNNSTQHIFFAQLLRFVKQQTKRTDGNDDKRTPGIRCEYCLSHFRQIAHNRTDILLRQLLQGLRFLDWYETAEEQTRHQCKQQGNATSEGERNEEWRVKSEEFATAILFTSSVHPFLQSQHGKQRNGKLSNNKNWGYRAELGIHRHIVDKEIGQRHEVLTPWEHNTQDGCRQQSPFHRTFHDKES